MNEEHSHDKFVSPVLDDNSSGSSVQGGVSQQPLGQEMVPDDNSSSSSSHEEEDNNEATAVKSAPKPTQPSKAEMRYC